MNIKEFYKLKVGDKVKINKDVAKSYRSVKQMCKYSGEIATIQKCVFEARTPYIKIDLDSNMHCGWLGNGWAWTADMIECKVEDEPTIAEHLVKGNKIIVKLSNGKVGVAACSPDDEFDMCEGLKLAIDRAYGKVPGFKKGSKKSVKKNEAESKVKEVNRKATKGEWIKIVNPYDTKGKYKKGDVLKVIDTAWSEDVRTAYDGFGNTGTPGYNYINRDEYVVLENYKPEPEVKEVKRKAKAGEYVKIMDPFLSLGKYSKGDVLRVMSDRGVYGSSSAITCRTADHGEYTINDTEYVVLENYKPNKK